MFRFQSINHTWAKIKAFALIIDKKEVFMILGITLAGIGGCGIGLVIGLYGGRPPVTLERFALETPIPVADPASAMVTPASTSTTTPNLKTPPKTYVASKSGKKYHLPTCIGAKSIAEANKVWFSSKAEAERAGYTPAGNCKGI